MKVLLVRHAESENNAREAMHLQERDPDPELTPLGHAQSAEVAKLIAKNYKKDIRCIYTSPMKRSLQSCAPLAGMVEGQSIPINIEIDLHEQGGLFVGSRVACEADKNVPGIGGSCSGITDEDLKKDYSFVQPTSSISSDGWWNGGYEEIALSHVRAARVVEWIWDIVTSSQDPNSPNHKGMMVLYTHGMFLDTLMRYLCYSSPPIDASSSRCTYFLHSNTAMTLLDLRLLAKKNKCSVRANSDEMERVVGVLFINSVEHLPPDLRTGHRNGPFEV
eukprot:GHVL01034024.1.p1 GENE.GHVL01034024.1~~GHVL01034024.1.p1  ORF type:complete len:276 (+),score=52.96 GHVL01034024.1:1237-2064(+)